MSRYIPALQAFFLIASIALAYFMTRKIGLWSRGAGERWGLMSRPNERSSHTRPTSRLGGLAIAAGMLAPSVLFVLLVYVTPRSAFGWGGNLAMMGWLLCGALTMFAVGLADDRFDLHPAVKFLGQCIAVAALVPAGLDVMSLRGAGPAGVAIPGFSFAVALLWVLFFVNAFNFMDGMDGFAVRFAMTVFFWLFLIVLIVAVADLATSASRPEGGLEIPNLRIEFFLLAIFNAACSGFHRINREPARVFMGDGGSLTLGYLLAIQVLMADGAYYTSPPYSALPGKTVTAGAVLILLLPFCFDVTLTLLRRIHRGENLLSAHRSHLYQRLMIQGMSHGEVVRLNVRYFRICVALTLIYSLTPLGWVRLGTAMLAVAAMTHYWTTVLARERAAKAA